MGPKKAFCIGICACCRANSSASDDSTREKPICPGVIRFLARGRGWRIDRQDVDLSFAGDGTVPASDSIGRTARRLAVFRAARRHSGSRSRCICRKFIYRLSACSSQSLEKTGDDERNWVGVRRDQQRPRHGPPALFVYTIG